MSTKVRFSGLSGLDAKNTTIINLADPVNQQDAVTKIFSTNASNLSTGTIAPSILGNSTVYVGTSAIALNRASAAISLTGITSIDGNAATATLIHQTLDTATASAVGLVWSSASATGNAGVSISPSKLYFYPSTGNFYSAGSVNAGSSVTAAGVITAGTSISATTGIFNNGVSGNQFVQSATGNFSSGIGLMASTTANEIYSTSGIVFRIGTSISASGSGSTGEANIRIDNSGNLLLAQTVTGYVNSDSLDWTLSGNGHVNHASGTASGTLYIGFGYNGKAIGSITQNGTTAVKYNTSSDLRLKTNVQPAGESGSIIDQLNIVQYDWKADGHHVDFGGIAQEMHDVFPEAILAGDSDPEIIKDLWQVDWSVFVPLLLQEVKTLRQRVLALENKTA